MDKSSVVALGGVVIMVLAAGSCMYWILVKRRSPELVLILAALFIAGISIVGIPMINPDAALTPLLFDLAGTLILGIFLGGSVCLINLVRKRRQRPNDVDPLHSDVPANPYDDGSSP